MDEHEAIEALTDLGLTTYEAKMFVGLQRLGTGSARDVARVSDVPRPQVYSTAESLAERGLIEVQHAEPIRYRPVPIDEAKATLRNRFEHRQETAFEYIEDVRTEASGIEQREDIWTISGRDTVTARIVDLVRRAEEEVLFAVQSAAILEADTEATLREAAAAGVSVTVISRDPSMCDRFEGVGGVDVVEPAIADREGAVGRMVVVDGTTVLLSAFSGEDGAEPAETAIWSGETEFARVLVRLVRRSVLA